MAVAALDSDHINYLIWRYLQEHGYGRAAVQLSRDWGFAHPQELSFAPKVNTYDLISILQDGLAYDELVESTYQNYHVYRQRSPTPGSVSTNRRYKFIDERKRKGSGDFEGQRLDGTPRSVTSHKRRKAEVDGATFSATPEAHIASRRGSRNGLAEQQNQHDDLMQLDHTTPDQGVCHVAESQAVRNFETDNKAEVLDQILQRSTLDLGQSVGVQSSKTVQQPLAKTIAEFEIPRADIVHVAWGEVEPNSLLASGGTLWRSWRVYATDAAGEASVNPEDYTDLGPVERAYFVTATARAACKSDNPVDRLVGAIEGGSGTSQLCLHGRNHVGLVSGLQTATSLALRWSVTANSLLSLIVDEGKGCFNIWEPESLVLIYERSCARPAVDAVWISESAFVACGEHFIDLHQANYEAEKCSALTTKRLATDITWEKLRHDPIHGKVACLSPTAGAIGVLDLQQFALVKTEAAHEGDITDLEWQPASADKQDMLCLLATSSTDGRVKLWRYRESLECIRTFILWEETPAMVLAFSPDGSHIAAGTDGKVVIWNVAEDRMPVIVWCSAEHPRSFSQDIKGTVLEQTTDGVSEEYEIPYHALAWNKEGNMIVYGQRTRIAVIDFASQPVLMDEAGQMSDANSAVGHQTMSDTVVER